jgi:hypothetical protein
MEKLSSAFVGCLMIASASTAADATEKAAVFDFQLANLGQLPPTEADRERLPRLSDELRTELEKSGLFEIVPISPAVKTEVEKSSELRSCGGCADDFAKQLGAQVAITGEIQKVSALILNINVYIKKIGSNKPEQGYSVDLRGDTNESFDRAVKYIVKEVIVPRLNKTQVEAISPGNH